MKWLLAFSVTVIIVVVLVQFWRFIQVALNETHTRDTFGLVTVAIDKLGPGVPLNRQQIVSETSRRFPDVRNAEGELLDSWERPIRIATAGASITLRSAGNDGMHGTGDDVVLETTFKERP